MEREEKRLMVAERQQEEITEKPTTRQRVSSIAIRVCQILLFATGFIWALFLVPHGHLDKMHF